MAERKGILLRLDPAVHDALVRWASDELRSTNAQIEFLLRRALTAAGRMPDEAGGIPRRGRPRTKRSRSGEETADGASDTSESAGTSGGTEADVPADDNESDAASDDG